MFLLYRLYTTKFSSAFCLMALLSGGFRGNDGGHLEAWSSCLGARSAHSLDRNHQDASQAEADAADLFEDAVATTRRAAVALQHGRKAEVRQNSAQVGGGMGWRGFGKDGEVYLSKVDISGPPLR